MDKDLEDINETLKEAIDLVGIAKIKIMSIEAKSQILSKTTALDSFNKIFEGLSDLKTIVQGEITNGK